MFASYNTVFFSKLDPALIFEDLENPLPAHPATSTKGNGKECESNSCKDSTQDLENTWDDRKTANSILEG